MRPLNVAATALLLCTVATGCNGEERLPLGDGGTRGEPDSAPWPPWPEVPEIALPRVVASGLLAPCGLVVDRDVVYVAEEHAGRVVSVPVAGGDVEEVAADLGQPYMLAGGADGLAVTERLGGRVVLLRGSDVAVLADGIAKPGRIALRDSMAYWVDEGIGAADGAVQRVPLTGGMPEVLAAGLRGPRGLAVDDRRCYFTETGAADVVSLPLDGGEALRRHDPNGTPFGIVSEGTGGEVYWTSPGNRGGGWLHRSSLDLSADSTVSFSPPGPMWLSLHAGFIVWSTSQTVSRAQAVGGAYQDLVVQTSVCDFVIAEDEIFWTNASTGELLSTPATWP